MPTCWASLAVASVATAICLFTLWAPHPMTEVEIVARAAYANFKDRPNRDRPNTETWEQLTKDVRAMWCDFIGAGIKALDDHRALTTAKKREG